MENFTDKTPMPFGKHKGTLLANVPASYLLWLRDNAGNLSEPLKGYLNDNLDALKKEVQRNTRNNAR